MRRLHFSIVCSALAAPVLTLTACAGAPPAGAPPAASPTSAAEKAGAPAPVAANGVGKPASASEVDDPKPADPNESATAIEMTPLFTKQKPPRFPKATVSDHDCWQDMELSGEAKKDYDSLIARCGTPTGVVEYASPQQGHLHHKHDQRDTFRLKLAGGYCFRYFAVGDSTIDDLDILVERNGGDIVGDDQVTGAVAIIQSSKPWCMDDDAEYDFDVAVDGKGQGNYVIGVWARPK